MTRIYPAKVGVQVVTFNSAWTIKRCLDSVFTQDGFELGGNLFIRVFDNASHDGTPELLRQFYSAKILLHESFENCGFCAAHNRLFAEGGDCSHFLILNPDVRLEPDCLVNLCTALDRDSRAGSACPKLIRADSELQPVSPRTLDAAGMYITPSLRHFDRGSEQPDDGSFDRPQYVFGGSGAALLCRRDFLTDMALGLRDGRLHVLDERFFAYREDADLAWRAQRQGWRCLYAPSAVAYHKRLVLPERRRDLPAAINRYGVRNRFLLQFGNVSLLGNLHCLFPAALRNLVVAGGVILAEQSSIRGLFEAVAALPAMLRRRALLSKRRRASELSLRRWFAKNPYAEEVLQRTAAPRPITKLAALVVNFNSGDRLGRCLRSLASCRESLHGRNLEIVVHDNASADSSAKTAQESAPTSIRWFFSQQNIGFAAGLNEGARRAPESEALLILNPDVQLDGPSLERLCSALEFYPQLGVAAPVLTNSDGTAQLGFTARRFPSFGSLAAELLLLHRLFPRNPWTAYYKMLDDPFFKQAVAGSLSGPFPVEQPAAACILVRRSAFDALRGFDESFFPAWFEDVDFAKRLTASGFLSAVIPESRAEHEGGYSADFIGKSSFNSIFYRNLLHYTRKHWRRSAYYAFRIVFAAGMLLRSITFSLRRAEAAVFLRLIFASGRGRA